MIRLFRDEDFKGGEIVRSEDDGNLVESGFNDVITSVIVESGVWTLYEHTDFGGRSITVASNGGPDSDGRYPNSNSLGGRSDFFSSIKRNSDGSNSSAAPLTLTLTLAQVPTKP